MTTYYAPETATAADYMRKYNLQVFLAAKGSYHAYCAKLFENYSKDICDILDKHSGKFSEIQETERAEKETANKLPQPEGRIAWEAADLKYKFFVNEDTEIFFKEFMPIISKLYDKIVKASEDYWRNMLPFVRGTQYPEENAVIMFGDIQWSVWSVLESLCAQITGGYYFPEISMEDLQEILKALEQAKADYTAQQKTQYKDVTNGNFILSVTYGPIEFKLTGSSVELEYVEGIAGRVSFDWKKDQLEIGMGAGGKLSGFGMKSSFDGVADLGQLESKAYINFVFQTRKGRISNTGIMRRLCERRD